MGGSLRNVFDGVHAENSSKFNSINTCTAPKTGTTSWQVAFLAMQRNTSISQVLRDTHHVYGLLPYMNLLRMKSEINTDLELFGHQNILNLTKNGHPIEKISPTKARSQTFHVCRKFKKNNLIVDNLLNETAKCQGRKVQKFVYLGTKLPTVDVMAKQIFEDQDLGLSKNIMSVRHPLARLKSAWGDKLHQDPNNLTESYRLSLTRYISQFETKKSYKSKPEDAFVSFRAFLLYRLISKDSVLGDYFWNQFFE